MTAPAAFLAAGISFVRPHSKVILHIVSLLFHDINFTSNLIPKQTRLNKRHAITGWHREEKSILHAFFWSEIKYKKEFSNEYTYLLYGYSIKNNSKVEFCLNEVGTWYYFRNINSQNKFMIYCVFLRIFTV